MRTVLKQLKQYKRDTFLTMVFTTLEVIMEVLLPFITALIIDNGLEQSGMPAILKYSVLMLVMAVVSLFSGAMAGKFAASASSGFACNLRESMYIRVQDYSFSNIDKLSTAGLVTRMTTDVTNLQNAFQMIIRIAVRAPLMLVSSMVMCFLINRNLSLVFLAALCFLAVVLALIMKKSSAVFKEVFDRYDDLNASVQENVTAIRVVKAYVREDNERDKFNKAAQNLYRLFVKAESMLALNNPVMEVADGSIDFEHVSFVYKHGTGEDTLEDIDLRIKSGETIEIIGGTGCGKSSLVNLISRLYDASEGTVKFGGRDVREYDMEVLRNEVSVVLQKNVLFSGTILDNLRWGNENASEEECRTACEAACASEFIDRLPKGYDTWIERGGTNVSGGQKQRLCIARALLKKPKVLILDDSTSAVDTATDAKIRKAFQTYIPGTTKIIIAQRVSSVGDVERILVLDDGRINGFGTHEHLLENNEIYRDIYESQTQGGGDFDQAV